MSSISECRCKPLIRQTLHKLTKLSSLGWTVPRNLLGEYMADICGTQQVTACCTPVHPWITLFGSSALRDLRLVLNHGKADVFPTKDGAARKAAVRYRTVTAQP
ncbi:unnamed protein product [Lasius platythorax]|uniref:Uncharacterized protein n=1 Tax=Lasius platythorax TaxID=488582 RepID=A0AAV2NLE6_9HYME